MMLFAACIQRSNSSKSPSEDGSNSAVSSSTSRGQGAPIALGSHERYLPDTAKSIATWRMDRLCATAIYRDLTSSRPASRDEKPSGWARATRILDIGDSDVERLTITTSGVRGEFLVILSLIDQVNLEEIA